MGTLNVAIRWSVVIFSISWELFCSVNVMGGVPLTDVHMMWAVKSPLLSFTTVNEMLGTETFSEMNKDQRKI